MKPDDPNVQTWLEPELEAHVIASLLGEASAFEDAELERLMEESPEVAVFQRRLQAVHGLVGEAMTQGPDDDWKLPEDRRNKVLTAIREGNAPTSTIIAVSSPKRTRLWWLCSTATAAACVLLLGSIVPMSLRSVLAPAPKVDSLHKLAAPPAASSSTMPFDTDGTIDLTVQPEVVEFDGFMAQRENADLSTNQESLWYSEQSSKDFERSKHYFTEGRSGGGGSVRPVDMLDDSLSTVTMPDPASGPATPPTPVAKPTQKQKADNFDVTSPDRFYLGLIHKFKYEPKCL